jgi:hypothetical protein
MAHLGKVAAAAAAIALLLPAVSAAEFGFGVSGGWSDHYAYWPQGTYSYETSLSPGWPYASYASRCYGYPAAYSGYYGAGWNPAVAQPVYGYRAGYGY